VNPGIGDGPPLTTMKGNNMKYNFDDVNNYYGMQVFYSQDQFDKAYHQFMAIYFAHNEVEHGCGSLTDSQND